MAASTLLLCFGNSIGLLVVGRVLQGLSASIVWSVGCALLVDTMENNVGVALGYVGLSISAGFLIAPLIGGSVYSAAGYYAVYYIAFGVVAVDILLRLFMIEKKIARQWLDDDLGASLPGINANGPDAEAMALPVPTTSRPASEGRTQPPRGGNEEEKRTKTLGDSRRDLVAPSESTSIGHSIKVLLKSPRLHAALYGLFTQAGLMSVHTPTPHPTRSRN